MTYFLVINFLLKCLVDFEKSINFAVVKIVHFALCIVKMVHSSSGLGRRPLTPETRVRVPDALQKVNQRITEM